LNHFCRRSARLAQPVDPKGGETKKTGLMKNKRSDMVMNLPTPREKGRGSLEVLEEREGRDLRWRDKRGGEERQVSSLKKI